MFEIFLFSAACLCGLVMLVCRVFYPKLAQQSPEPWYLDYARSFFPVLLIVFLLRGFVAEPFRIPSGSMLPTLEVGDFILVNKFKYGIRLPITHTKIVEMSDPQRGDVMVFRYPIQPDQNYIKRVIGLPGDVVAYQNSTLTVNGNVVAKAHDGDYIPVGKSTPSSRFLQTISVNKEDREQVEFSTLEWKIAPRRRLESKPQTVPEGQYFVMGDNRDNSTDSRAWGFVPDDHIVGKAFFIWFHYDGITGGGLDFGRIGTSIEAKPLVD